MTTPDIAVGFEVEAGAWGDETKLEALIDSAVAETFAELGVTGGHSELSVLFTDDMAIQVLNREWRDKDKPTNVLSFPAFPIGPDDPLPPMLGDIAIAFETVERECEAENKSFDHHLTHLLVHGLLHLIGFDHETDEEAEEMEGLERLILRRLAIPDPYSY